LERIEQTGRTHIINGKKIISRKKTSNKWFETQDQIGYWDDFSKPKIVWGNLAQSAQFAAAPSGMFVNAPCPMIVPFNGYILAVLNSKLGDWFIRHLGVTRNGGYFEYKPMFVEQLPIPMLDLPKSNYLANLAQNPTNSNQDEVDDIIYKIYGLENNEIAYIAALE
jgi:hypothetical protein